MDMSYEEAKAKLQAQNQEQVLSNYSRLDESTQKELREQISKIDFKQFNKLYDSTKEEVSFENDVIEPISYIEESKISKEELNKYLTLGENAIKNGEYSVVTMAGGQGTRLGHSGPKGTFDIGLDSHKSIFEILVDNLKSANEKYNVIVPWYIMTSKENDAQTQEFFEKNNYFGYDKNSIKFFQQGKLPMCNEQGKILVNEQGIIKEASDGHGGIFQSMKRNNITTDMEKRGVKWAFIGPVDNVLVKMVDPILLGVMIDKNVSAGGKSVVKANPSEKVGVFCKRNGKPGVVEYTEISKEMAEKTDANGELVFGESHINCNMFSVKAIEEVANKNLPYHIAHKKASYLDENGNLVVPDKPNAYKFESFIFDAFDMLDDMAILRVKREEEFAPVKNAEGTDSPETARALYKKFNMKNKKAVFITQGAVIAAIYVVLVIVFDYWSFGPIQFRVAEALTILPYFTPAAIPGLFIGCLIANILGGAVIWDIVFGSIATLIGAVGTYLLRKNKWLAPLPPIIANTIIVPWVLKYAYGSEGMIPFFMLTVGGGEIIVCGILGMLLLFALNKYRHQIFKDL